MKLLAGLLLAGAALWAQQDMEVVTELITDASGAAIPGAKVTVANLETNEVRSVESGPAAVYTVGPLRIGLYSVTVERPGFKRAVRPEIRLSAQDRARVDVQLEVGQIADTVTITSEAPLLESETSSLAHVVNQQEMRRLPLNGRNFPAVGQGRRRHPLWAWRSKPARIASM